MGYSLSVYERREAFHYFVVHPFAELISPFGQHRSNHHYTGWKHFPHPMSSGAGRWTGSMEWYGKVHPFQTVRTLRINPSDLWPFRLSMFAKVCTTSYAHTHLYLSRRSVFTLRFVLQSILAPSRVKHWFYMRREFIFFSISQTNWILRGIKCTYRHCMYTLYVQFSPRLYVIYSE